MLSAELKAGLIKLTETLIIPHITKTEFNNCFIIHLKKKINMVTHLFYTVLPARFYICFLFERIPHTVIFCNVGC